MRGLVLLAAFLGGVLLGLSVLSPDEAPQLAADPDRLELYPTWSETAPDF